MIGIPARSTLVDAEQYQKDFVPYGTPCDETFDAGTQKLESLRNEVEELRRRLADLIAEKDNRKRDRA